MFKNGGFHSMTKNLVEFISIFTCLFAEQLSTTDIPEWYDFNGDQQLHHLLPYKLKQDQLSSRFQETMDGAKPEVLLAAFQIIKSGYFRTKAVSTANDHNYGN